MKYGVKMDDSNANSGIGDGDEGNGGTVCSKIENEMRSIRINNIFLKKMNICNFCHRFGLYENCSGNLAYL